MVTFGSRVICGPNVQIYAGTHSTDVCERQKGLERAYPISVGDDVWIGGGAVLIGPCTIGNGTTIAAGAVVRGDIPPNVVVGGVPARIIKHLGASKSDNSNLKVDGDSAHDSKTGHSKHSGSITNQPHQSKSSRSPGTRTANQITASATDEDRVSSTHSEEASDPLSECFLANIPSSLSSSDLESALGMFGEVRSLTMDRSRRLGFVRFSTPQAAEAAVEGGRGPDGFVVVVDNETKEKMVVGIERRRMSDTSRTFNPDLITSTRCLIRRLPNTVDFDELKRMIEEKAGPLVEWTVQDFTSPDPTKPSVDKFISLEFEQLCGAREAVRLSQTVNGGIGGIDVPGEEGLKARIEARKQFSPHSAYRSSYRGHHPHSHHQQQSSGYHSNYLAHHPNQPRSYRGSYAGHPPRGSSFNHYSGATGPSNHQPSKPFNGSFSRWKPRRSAAGTIVGSE